jgi:acetyl-CoA C-acetyltransferase
MTGCIVGWAHTAFGKHDGLDVEALIGKVAGAAIEDAGIEASDIDRVYVGHFNAGFSKQDFPSSLVFQSAPGLRFKPATRLENACATGSAAVHAGLTSLAARQARLVLVVGVEKMTDTPAPEIGANLLKASYLKEEGAIPGGFAGIFARIAQQYFQRHGDKSDALARIAAKNHRYGVANPYAQLRKDLGYEF